MPSSISGIDPYLYGASEKNMSITSTWSSRWIFILAATGSAVGLGNIWKFPYMTGENGGSAFVLLFLGCVLLIGLPVQIAEIMLGRRGRGNPVHSMRTVAIESGRSAAWGWLGFAGIATSFLLLSYYSVIAGFAAGYIQKAFLGEFSQLSALQIGTVFDDFQKSPWTVIGWHTVVMLMTALIVVRGLKAGLEKAIGWMVPGLFVILVFLCAYASTTSGFMQGVHFMFNPDWSAITSTTFLYALGHAFFSLSIATASMLIYGAYLSPKISIPSTALISTVLDTLCALLAGIAIFSLVFTHGLTPDQGPALVFKVLPIAFGHMSGGTIIGGLFFVLLVIAAITSTISMLEPMVAWVMEKWNTGRVRATIYTAGAAWLFGIGSALSFNVWQHVRLFERWTFYEISDNLVSLFLLPAGGLLLALFAGWLMQRKSSQEELGLKNPGYLLWRFLIRYMAPLAMLIVAYYQL